MKKKKKRGKNHSIGPGEIRFKWGTTLSEDGRVWRNFWISFAVG